MRFHPSHPDRFNRLGRRIELHICEVQPWESPGGPCLGVTSTGTPVVSALWGPRLDPAVPGVLLIPVLLRESHHSRLPSSSCPRLLLSFPRVQGVNRKLGQSH